jgi:hypothetical protein
MFGLTPPPPGPAAPRRPGRRHRQARFPSRPANGFLLDMPRLFEDFGFSHGRSPSAWAAFMNELACHAVKMSAAVTARVWVSGCSTASLAQTT